MAILIYYGIFMCARIGWSDCSCGNKEEQPCREENLRCTLDCHMEEQFGIEILLACIVTWSTIQPISFVNKFINPVGKVKCEDLYRLHSTD
uniref:Uncharacterized protein n=1 Tax=Arundo donax TaxID=35708 RepID=A0A0A9GDX3_ARUDO